MKKKIIVIVASLMLLTGAWYWLKKASQSLYIDLQADGNGASRNASRNYNFLKTYKPWLVDSDPAFTLANRSLNGRNIRWIVNTYDYLVAPIARSLNVPRALIYALIAVESGSVAASAGFVRATYESKLSGNIAGAIGIMQIKPITATETLQIANNKKLITAFHRSIIESHIGKARTAELFTILMGTQYTYVNNKIIAYSGPKSELNDPELNILIGVAKLANLIDNYGETNLHQVFYAYNQGDRTVIARGLEQYITPSVFMKYISGEGSKYVKRILGLNGSLDIVINDLKINA